MNKKNLVGLGAILSTLVSLGMWIWYGSLPSFDKAENSFNETNSTFEEVIK